MKRIAVYAVIILHLLMMNIFLGCERDDEITVDDGNNDPTDSTGTEPDEPPPPPPPPGCLTGESDYSVSSEGMPLELIAQKVLSGEYGEALQKILADEISTCITQMAEERVVQISSGDMTSIIRINSDSKDGIMFNSGYIADEVISGDYGNEAKETLVLMMKWPARD